ncbi:hypothetical protein D3C85_888470 [compost metagenome]
MQLVIDLEHRAGRARVHEVQRHTAARHRRLDLQRIGQGARGPHARFLEERLRRRRRLDMRSLQMVQQRGGRARNIGQSGKRGVGRACEIERRNQVAADRAMPGADGRDGHAETLFDELPHRGVVGDLGVDPAALAPRRDDVERHPRPEAPRPHRPADLVLGMQVFALIVVEVEALHINRALARQRAVGAIGRDAGRRQVIELPVVLIEGEEEDRLAPHLGIGGQGVEHPRRELRPLDRRRSRGMLGIDSRRQDPRDGRQGPRLHIRFKLLQRPVAHALFIEGRTRFGRAEAVERQAAMHGAGPVVVRVLIDLPVNARAFQHVGDGGPGQGRALVGVARLGHLALDPAAQVVGLGVAFDAGDALITGDGLLSRAGPEDDPVRVRPGRDRAMIAVRQSEGLRQGELEGDILAAIMAHRILGLEPGPLAQPPLPPGRLSVREAVRGAGNLHGVGPRRIQVEGRDVLLSVRLAPHLLAARKRDRMAITETAHPPHGAEVMIERPVLLHQDDDVLHVLDGAVHPRR